MNRVLKQSEEREFLVVAEGIGSAPGVDDSNPQVEAPPPPHRLRAKQKRLELVLD
jgi:hypothetical protein